MISFSSGVLLLNAEKENEESQSRKLDHPGEQQQYDVMTEKKQEQYETSRKEKKGK